MPARFTPLDPARLTAAQVAVANEVARGRRGTVPANVVAWLADPELARRAAALGEYVRYETALAPHVSELAILVVARHWNCAYEWAVHAVAAVAAGLAPATIEAIGAGAPPMLDRPADMVYRFAAELVSTGRVADVTYHQAMDALGEVAVVDLMGVVGYYTLVAFTLNAREVPAPPGAPLLPSRA